MNNSAWGVLKPNEKSDDEILPVFAQNLFTLKFIFSCSHGQLFSVLLQAIIYVFNLKKMWNDCKILKITLVQIFVH